jgi:FMN phosphatase YigB (HAD superfamily)
MIRAVLFDFYGVWLPDVFAGYLAEAEQHGQQAVAELDSTLYQYFHGQTDIEGVAGSLRYKLSRPDIDAAQFRLDEHSISPAIVDFMRELHGHFVKLGVLANLGTQEYQLLNDFNQHNQVFETIAGPLPFQMEQRLLSNEVFARALQTIGEPPASCLIVTGDPAYQDFARRLGMTVLPFEGFPKLRQEIEQILASELSS